MRAKPWQGRSSSRRCRTGVAMLCLLLAAGCAPKRVVRGRVQTAPAAAQPVAGKPAPASEAQAPRPPRAAETREPAGTRAPVAGLVEPLPSPEPRGPSGRTVTLDAAASSTLGAEAAILARQQLGKPYQWGASGPDRFDCSGLVQHVYGALGVNLPRVSRDQSRAGRQVKRSQLQAGDLLFFAVDGGSIDHVGIYVGNDTFVHAPRRYVPVKTESMNNAYWRQRFRLARRVP